MRHLRLLQSHALGRYVQDVFVLAVWVGRVGAARWYGDPLLLQIAAHDYTAAIPESPEEFLILPTGEDLQALDAECRIRVQHQPSSLEADLVVALPRRSVREDGGAV